MIEIDNIYNEDCLEGMKRIPDGSVDAIICDLPYGTTKNSWDCLIPLDKLWAEYKRVIKTSGAIVLFSQQPFTSALVMSNPKMFRYEWIWEKEMGTGFLNANYAPL
jgi:site-specific DNA-methyltransferase (adenine-specific)